MKIGFTCSAFDLFHAGHALMLKEAKSVCDYLIVGLHDNPNLERPSKNAPILSLVERQILLKSCQYVDEIIVYHTESDLCDILLSIPIDVRIVGEEYKNKQFTGSNMTHMKIHYNDRKHFWSSSDIRDRINDSKD